MPRKLGWRVTWPESVIEDLEFFEAIEARFIVQESTKMLSANPTAETKRMKTLRPNKVAQRQLRIGGPYRVQFNVNEIERTVMIVVVGEKRGASLFVRGKERTEHETGPAE